MKTCATCVVLATAAVGVTAFAFLGGAGPAPVTVASGLATGATAAAGVFTVDKRTLERQYYKVEHNNVADFWATCQQG